MSKPSSNANANDVMSMFLVSRDELGRMRDQQTREYIPEVRTLSTLQAKLDELLMDVATSDEDKLAMLENARSKYENALKQTPGLMRDAVRHQAAPEPPAAAAPAVPAVPAAPAAPAAQPTPPPNIMLRGLNIKESEMATRLYEHITRNSPHIKINRLNNRVSVKDVPLRMSNINKLLQYVVSESSPRSIPAGAIAFAKALVDSSVPAALLANPKLNILMRTMKKEEKSFDIPRLFHGYGESDDSQSGSGLVKRKRSNSKLLTLIRPNAKILRLYAH